MTLIETNKILQGDALTVLKTLHSESMDCVVTSPPYWALRAYQTTPQIWDAKNGCVHDFHTKESLMHNGRGDAQKSAKFSEQETIPDFKIESSFCSKCGAWKGELGLEPSFQLYIKHLCDIFDEVKRVLKKEGTCWVNLGDTYYTKSGSAFENDTICNRTNVENKGINRANNLRGNGLLPEKCLCQIPSRFAIEMCNRGWILRNKIIWYKRNCMPSSVSDRFTVDFEEIFFFIKSKKYWFEQQFVPHTKIDSRRNERIVYDGKGNPDTRQFSGGANYLGQGVNGRNMRCVWDITTKGYPDAHFAIYPEDLVVTPIKAGCPQFICKKCGKAREPIFKSEYVKKEVEWHSEKYELDDEQSKRLGRLQPTGDVKNTSRKVGYTDCGCNAGFEGGVVLDPFFGAGTTGLVARKLLRNWVGIELNSKYVEIAKKRIAEVPQRLDNFIKPKDVITNATI